MTDYTVLRDLAAARTVEPWLGGGGTGTLAVPDLGTAGVRIDVQQLDKNDVRALSRDPEVRAIAPGMPTRLIHPVDEAGGGGVFRETPNSGTPGGTAAGG